MSILWGLVLIFISGLLGSQIAALIVQIIPNENSLMNAIYENHQRRTLVVPKQIRTRWYFSKKEYSAILLNFVIAGLGWPLILIPVLLPLGVIVFSYGLGKEAFAASEKSYFDKKLDTWSEQGHYPGFGYFVGLGLPSVLLGLIPILGFLGFPIVRITSMLAASPEREYLMMDNFRIKKF